MWLYIAVTVSLFVIFTNFIVLALICRLRKLQTLRNVPLAGLATADILVGLLWIPLATASNYLPENKGLCRAALSCEILTMHASLFNLIAVSTERWIAIFKPLHYHQIASKTVVISIMAMSWSLSIVMLVAFLLADKHENDINECDIVKYINIWLLYVTIIIFYLVCGIMILMQMKVYFVVREQLRKIRPVIIPGNVKNGLIAATSFIIEKSFKIENSTENNGNSVESQRESTILSQQSAGCEEVEMDVKCRVLDKEVTKQARTGRTKKEERRKLRTLNDSKVKIKKIVVESETYRGGEKGKYYIEGAEGMGANVENDTGSSTRDSKPDIKVCIKKKKVHNKEQCRFLHRLQLKKDPTQESNGEDEIETINGANKAEKLSTQEIDKIFVTEDGPTKENEVNWPEQCDHQAVKQEFTQEISIKKQAYLSADQDSKSQKSSCTKKPLASFAKMFSVIKTQKKLEFARAAATNIVCLCFVLMWAPKSTIDLLTGLGYCDNCSLAHSVSAVLAWTNSGINALIYAWRMHEFRQAMRNILLGKKRMSTNRRM